MGLASKRFEKLSHKNPNQDADGAERGTAHAGRILQEWIGLTSTMS